MYHKLLRGLQKTQLINGLRTFTVSDGMQSSIKYKSLQVFFSPFQRKQQILEKQNCFPFLITVFPLWSQQSWVFLQQLNPIHTAAGSFPLKISYSVFTMQSSTFLRIHITHLKKKKILQSGNSVKMT